MTDPRPSLSERLRQVAEMLTDDWDEESYVLQTIRESAEALEAAAREQEWQPIDTAPKDGRWLLMWEVGQNSECPYGLFWSGSRWDDGSGDSYQDYKPTHWKPLPAAPPIRTAQERGR